MTPTRAKKGAKRYRYYVLQAVLQGRGRPAITRVPVPEIEAVPPGSETCQRDWDHQYRRGRVHLAVRRTPGH